MSRKGCWSSIVVPVWIISRLQLIRQQSCNQHATHSAHNAMARSTRTLPCQVLWIHASTMACHVKRDLPTRAHGQHGHTHTQSKLFSVEWQVCICWSCSNLLLYTIHLHKTSSSSQVLHSSLRSAHGLNAMHWICVRVSDERLHMTEINMHTYTPDTQYIHCKHYIHNAVNEITHS